MSSRSLRRVVVIGAGVSGARACEQLRRQGYDGELTIVGLENCLPYDRPPLSKGVLRGERDDSLLSTDLAGLDVATVLDECAVALDLANRELRTERRAVPFDGAVIATGADPIRLPGDGPQLTLRTIHDALALREQLRKRPSIIIIGASWIGGEVATAAVAYGCRVICLEAGPNPAAQSLGSEVGRRLAPWWREVDLRTTTGVSSIEEGGVLLDDGTALPADVVVTGVGARPATSWLAGSGLVVDRGVHVDEWLRAAPGVVAVGDVAARWSPRYGRRMRVEHWDNAVGSAAVAAAALLHGSDTTRPPQGVAPYDPVPYFWSDQFGHKLQYAGHHQADDRMAWRKNSATGGWSATWLDAANEPTAVLAADWPAELVAGRRVLATRTRREAWATHPTATPAGA